MAPPEETVRAGDDGDAGELLDHRQQLLPFVDLTSLVDASHLDALDVYLREHIKFSPGGISVAGGELGLFTAKGYKYGDSIDLTDRDTSGWCADTFIAYCGDDDFKQCRAHRGDPATWRPNTVNARALPGVLKFLVQEQKVLEQVGKISIIFNKPGDKGVEHADIEFNDLVSEFIWIRPRSSKKKFYVRHAGTSEKVLVSPEMQVVWFDDHLLHNLESQEDSNQYSIRVDGRFSSTIREKLCREGMFANEGLREILANQEDGPQFLKECNEPPDESDEEDDNG